MLSILIPPYLPTFHHPSPTPPPHTHTPSYLKPSLLLTPSLPPIFPLLSQPITKMPGQSGGHKSILLELKLIADVGLVGFPNVSTELDVYVIDQTYSLVLDDSVHVHCLYSTYPYIPIIAAVRTQDTPSHD